VGRIVLRLVLFAAAVAIGLGLGVAALAAHHAQTVGRILPGVSVAGVDVGGRTPEEARSAVEARLGALGSGSIVLASGIGSTRIAFADVGRRADIDAMLRDAAAIGRGGTWFDESIGAIRLRMKPVDVPLRLLYEPSKAAAAIDAYAARMALDPVDASVGPGRSSFVVIPGIEGRTLDVESAKAAVDAAMRDPASADGLRIPVAVRPVVPKLSTSAAEAARDAALAMVADVKLVTDGRTWTLRASRIRSWISFGWVDGAYRPTLDGSHLPAWLENVAKSVARPVRDAEFLRDKHGRIVGSKADRAGRALDVKGSSAAIVAAIHARAEGAAAKPLKLPVVVVAPKLTTAEAARKAPLMVMVGSWTTYYQVSAHNGFAANITVPTRVLNGTVVQPGATFDFWDALGEVSFRTGYRLGGAIVGGHSVEGRALAGGICAASTTLFNAALRGGFDILARQPHWYYITRYPLGLDATVSNTQTMRFRNDTAFPILIRGFASPGVVRYEIWSVPNGRTVTLSRPSVSNVVKGYDTTVLAADLKKGTSERTEYPVDGKDVVVTRTVRDAAGRVIHHETFVSHYHRMVGINRIGIG
jgi:vancomycin resistance protein YoaR